MNALSKEGKIGLFTQVLGLYFLCLILGAMNIGAMGSLLKILGILPVAIWMMRNHKVKMQGVIIASLVYVLICTLSTIWSINFGASYERAKTQILFLILLLATAGYEYDPQEIKYLRTCLIWSSRITVALVLISADYAYGRLYLNSFVREDPNYLCGYFTFGIAYCLTELLETSRGKKRLLRILELLIYLYVIFATGSRGGLFAVIIEAGVIILLFKNEGRGYSLAKRIFTVLIMVAGYFIATYFIDSSITARYTLAAISESNGTGRYELWEDALQAFRQSSFLRQIVGYGTGTVRNVTFLFSFHRHNVLHNMYVENLIEIGLIGLVSYVFHIFSFMKISIKWKDIFCISVLSGMIVLSLSTSIYTFKPYWNIMLYIICLMKAIECNSDTHYYKD